MTSYVPADLRQFVIKRAGERCEYCLYPQQAAMFSFEMEHVIAEKHGGTTTADNLALACPYCNRVKGSDLGSLDPETGQLTPFFNPRIDVWQEHFLLEDGYIKPLTPQGRVTVFILQFNHPDRAKERKRLVQAGLFVSMQ
jgi:hypothetical protein